MSGTGPEATNSLTPNLRCNIPPLQNFYRNIQAMRHFLPSKTILSITLCIFLSAMPVFAGPYPKDSSLHAGFFYLFGRSCSTYCGADNQYCCGSGEACYTNQANIAYCSANADVEAGGYAVYTTTYTETNFVLRTSTYTSSWGAVTPHPPHPPAATSPAICTTSLGESSCGDICCASNQRCAVANSCTAYSSVFLQPTRSTTYLAPAKPTPGGLFTTSATTTVPFEAPATASGSTLPIASEKNSLSGGAVAGIVVGVIAGILFLLLLCFLCIIKKGCDSICGMCGMGRKSRRAKNRYSSPSTTPVREKTTSGKFWEFLEAVISGTAIILGFKSPKDRRDDRSSSTETSQFSSQYYSDSYTGSNRSTVSSDRHTRNTPQITR